MQSHSPSTRIRAALAGLLAAVGFAATHAEAQSLPSTGVRAVTTYEAAGLYWSSPGANSSSGCDVRYRKAGDAAWSTGLALWFDAASNECRGSLVNLAPGTSYEAQLGVGGTTTRAIAFTTWSNLIPVARTVGVASGAGTYNITEGGSASGYVVYDGAGAVRDAQNASPYNITINASHVIVRNLTLRGAQQHAILISPNVHDVIIEDNDISGWGRTRDGTWGTDMDSGVRAVCTAETLTRVTIQRNRIHDPRYSANSWTDGHPAGPQAITFSYCGGNHVFRWNEIYSTNGNRFNDGMGGEDNFSTIGFPNNDSDIYGNKITHAWDDGIEAEGANKNVRIWGNYLDRTATGIATTLSSVGPVYIFRNVFNRNQFYDRRASDQDSRQPFFKSGSSSGFGNGRRYLLHNTMLQATQSGSSYGLGGGAGVGGTGNSQLVRNTVSMNNVYHLWKPNSAVYQAGSDNVFQNDMFNGSMGTAVVSGINATPQYAAGHGWQSEAGGQYQLAAGTRGHDGGVRIANFNDGFIGAAPDVGAAEAGAPAMAFGLAASTGNFGQATPGPCVAGDTDTDGISDCLEAAEGRNSAVKDNDIFGSARLFAMQQFRDFLAREGDASGIAFWTGEISSGARTRAQVAESLFNSAEFQGTISPITRLYFAYFMRIPDYGGLNFWIGQYRAGNSIDAISNSFAQSSEFINTYGPLDNGQFVDRVYQNVLGRAADPGGRAFWIGQLDSGARTRGQVMLGFSESDEYRTLVANEVYVTMMYVGMLRRAPDPGGFSYWVNYLDGGNSGLALIGGFLDAPEYRNRFLP